MHEGVQILFPTTFTATAPSLMGAGEGKGALFIKHKGIQILVVDRLSPFATDVLISKPQGYSQGLLNIEARELRKGLE